MCGFDREDGNGVMNPRMLWRQAVISLIMAGPAGGFILGILNAGDPDPNPIGRLVHACMMAVMTPLHAGFPPNGRAGPGYSFNAWPHIAVAFGLTLCALLLLERRSNPDRSSGDLPHR